MKSVIMLAPLNTKMIVKTMDELCLLEARMLMNLSFTGFTLLFEP